MKESCFKGCFCSKAFTLIELLVVVLIIGILAAVAVPQYRVAVAKSRYANLKVFAESLAKAEEVYFLANGTYTDNLKSLDIGIPGEINNNQQDYVYFEGGYCYVTFANSWNRVACNNRVDNMNYNITLQHSSVMAGQRRCLVKGTIDPTDWRTKICKAETNKSTYRIDDSKYIEFLY